MKLLLVGLAAGLAVAAAAFVADSPLLLLVSVGVIGVVIVGLLALGVRSAQERDYFLPSVVVLSAALALAAVGVSSIVFGGRGDAPGLVLLGIVLIVAAITGVFAFGLRTAQRLN